MATVTRLKPTNGFYGHSGNNNYTNSAANHLYVGKSPSTSNYRSRITFPSLRNAAGLGNSRIEVKDIVLRLRRDDGGPARVTAGASSSNAWGATRSGVGVVDIEASTGWKSINLKACAEAVAGYEGNWHIHLTGENKREYRRVRFEGTGSANKPYLEVTWQYVAATITADNDVVELGENVVFTITPEVPGERHTLEYSIGETSGIIAELAGEEISWSTEDLLAILATEITDDDIGTILIKMTAYDESGAIHRTESYYLTVTIPYELKPRIDECGISLESGLSGYALAGLSYVTIAPKIDMRSTCGSNLMTVVARVVNGESEQIASWTEFTEIEDGVFACTSARSNVFQNAGEVTIIITATDSRGMSVEYEQTLAVCGYSSPEIEHFTASRYGPVYSGDENVSGYRPDDLGTHVYVDFKASVCSVKSSMGDELNSLAWHIEATNPVTGAVKETSGVGDLDVSVLMEFQETVPESEAWEYTLTVSDEAGVYAAEYSAVQTAMANFALAASKRGAAFGGIPHGTTENPMLESWYPLYAYNGIHGVNRYVEGEVETGGKWIDGKPIYRQVFCKEVAGSASNNTELGTLSDVEMIVRMDGMFERTGDSSLFVHPVPYYNSSTRYFLPFYNPSTGQVFMQATTAGIAHVVVDYTKKEGDD